ncbi:MAG: hypothetical protein KC442_20555 [Thermomicrobiales bacterium]|nr:hypothetical protein [Thermomicrobiales bacterium]
MDDSRFDDLVRRLGDSRPRRPLLGAGLTALAALGTGLAWSSEADARKKKKKKKKSCKKKKCGECQTCSKGKCLAAADGSACTGGACAGGTCRPPQTCSPAQVCTLSETCCTAGITNTPGDPTYCGQNQQEICSCPAGDRFCSGSAGSQCCLSGDSCAQTPDGVGLCVADTCSADNDFCSWEFAACSETCWCVTSSGGAHLCADFSAFTGCPASSSCSTDANCTGDDVCVNVGCRCGGGSLGVCLPPCVINMRRAASRQANLRPLRDRVGPLR